jgi:hypothetical protein
MTYFYAIRGGDSDGGGISFLRISKQFISKTTLGLLAITCGGKRLISFTFFWVSRMFLRMKLIMRGRVSELSLREF